MTAGVRHPESVNQGGAVTTAPRPDTRLRVLVGAIGVCLSAVPFRLADVQADLDLRPTGLTRSVRSIDEPIPARDGRILSADGRVLAEDVEAFTLLLNYRWLERPADARWLRGEALRSLDPPDRRKAEAVAEAERLVLLRREALWDAISELVGCGREELFRRFAAIQERVSALRRSVVARNSDRQVAALSAAPNAATWWQATWDTFYEAVTTPPRRSEIEPLVLLEETEHYAVAFDLPLSAAARVESDPERFPATRLRVESRRRYPHGAVAAHAIGYRFPTAGHDRTVGDFGREAAGRSGIERTYDRHLRGIEGLRRLWLDRRGEVVRAETMRLPRVGRDLVLSLDVGLQGEVERLLDAALSSAKSAQTAESPIPESSGGCVVAMDVRTGAILAAASAPRFDLTPASNRDSRFWRDASADPRMPLFDRTVSAALPPGSVFKIVSSVALLESGRIDPDEPIECVGYLERPDRHRDYIYRHFRAGHGPTTLTTAIAQSCNVYFFRAARKIGAVPLIEWASRFGYGRKTGIDLPAESAGHMAVGDRRSDALGLSIGQADLTATPMQVVRMTAAVANGGRLVTPHLVRGSGPARQGEDPVRPIIATVQVDGLKPDTLSRVREGLEQVVSHPQGSGYASARHPSISIAGKTGTAESGSGRPDHAWFAGYAPADDPQVAFVVLLEHAGSGGKAAGPLARATVDALLRRGLLRP